MRRTPIILALATTLLLCSCAATKDLGSIKKLEDGNRSATTVAEGAVSGTKRPDEVTSAIAQPYIEESLQDYAKRTGSILEDSDDGADAGALEAFEPESPLPSPEDPTVSGNIIGTDDRVTVRDTYAYPYSTIAFMKVHASCGDSWECSGFMVRANILMTAAHCLVCTDHHTTADSIELYFGYHSDGSYAYGYWGPTNYWYGTDFPGGYTKDNMGWDYGIVRLEENVGDQTGWLGMQVASDNAFDNHSFQVAGYRGGVLKYDTDTTSVRNDRLIWSYADTESGNSGGPIFSGDTASAIYIASNNSGKKNVGCRITQDVFDKVFEMSGEKPPAPVNNTQTALVVEPAMTGPDGYVLPYADSHLYTRDEIAQLSTYDLYIARNEIPARHGYIFTNQDLRSYFGSKNWYHGTLTGEQFRKREGILNRTEEENVSTILALEKKRGSHYVPK